MSKSKPHGMTAANYSPQSGPVYQRICLTIWFIIFKVLEMYEKGFF